MRFPLFRGHSDNSYKLIPAIARPIESFSSDTLIHEERNLIEMAKFKLPDVFREDMQPLELLALLQHYGVPTRLLDVTENALVALYFACCSKNNNAGTNGEVIVFKSNELEVLTILLSMLLLIVIASRQVVKLFRISIAILYVSHILQNKDNPRVRALIRQQMPQNGSTKFSPILTLCMLLSEVNASEPNKDGTFYSRTILLNLLTITLMGYPKKIGFSKKKSNLSIKVMILLS